jgi:hypothetical protein
VLIGTIEQEILRAINGAMETKSLVAIEAKKARETNLEKLIDASETVEREEDLIKNFNVDCAELMDYSRLAEEFHFEQLHYAAMESEYLPNHATQQMTKYKEWEEEETVYLLEESATMDENEADDTIQEVIYSAVFGGNEVSLEKKQRLDNWIKFNHTLFSLYKSIASVRSDDVNYSVH